MGLERLQVEFVVLEKFASKVFGHPHRVHEQRPAIRLASSNWRTLPNAEKHGCSLAGEPANSFPDAETASGWPLAPRGANGPVPAQEGLVAS